MKTIADVHELAALATAPPAVPVPEERFAAASAQILRAQREEAWKRYCPREFQEVIDPARMGAPPGAVRRALAWRCTFPGLWLWSERPGQGKTRTLWALARRARIELGRRVCTYTGQQWADDYWHHHMDGRSDELWGWLRRWDFLALDDVDKVNLADGRQQRALRELFDLIYRERMPCICTANVPIGWVAETLGASAARRVAESCEEIGYE